jgi:hypothetical protein
VVLLRSELDAIIAGAAAIYIDVHNGFRAAPSGHSCVAKILAAGPSETGCQSRAPPVITGGAHASGGWPTGGTAPRQT